MRHRRIPALLSTLAVLAACQDAPEVLVPEGRTPQVPAPTDRPDRTMNVGSANLWAGGVLYYDYRSDVDQATRNLIEKAAAHYNSMTAQTGVRLARGTNGGTYVQIVPTTGTPRVETLGNTGGAQPLYFKGSSWWQVAVHEFGHKLGQYHEHQRPEAERSPYITVTTAGYNNSNVGPTFSATRPERYDTWSIMHYSAGELQPRDANGNIIATYATFNNVDYTPLAKSIHMGLVATDVRSLARMYRPGGIGPARLASNWGGLCLDVPWQDSNGDGRLDVGAPVFINGCNPTEHQQVTFSPETGHMTFSIGGVTRCLASRSDALVASEQLIADRCQDISRQKWHWNLNGDGRIRRRSHPDTRGACADVNAGYAKGTKAPVLLQYCHTIVEGGANQTWYRA